MSTPPADTRDDRLPLRTLGQIILLFAVALLLGRFVVTAVVAITPPRHLESATTGLGRVRELARQLPEAIATPGPTGIFLGPSSVMHGLSPEDFDAVMHERGIPMTSYNMGALAMLPDHVALLAQRIHDEYVRTGRRATFIALDFLPHTITTPLPKFLHNGDLKVAALAGPSDLFAIARRSVPRALDILEMKIFGGMSQREVTTFLELDILYADAHWWPFGPKVDEALDDLYGERLFERQIKDGGGEYPYWSMPRRGELKRNFPDVADDYRELTKFRSSPHELAKSRAYMVKCCDLAELHVDEAELARVIETVEILKSVTDHMIVFQSPRTDAIKQAPAGLERAAVAVRRLEKATGVKVVSYFDDPRFTTADFFDAQHLNELGGREKFSKIFAEHIADELQATPK